MTNTQWYKQNKKNKNDRVIWSSQVNYLDLAALATAATTPDVAASAAVTRDISKFELSAFCRERKVKQSE